MMIFGSLGGGRSKCLMTLGVPLCRRPCSSLPKIHSYYQCGVGFYLFLNIFANSWVQVFENKKLKESPAWVQYFYF